jgi:hypothetical protein
MSLTRIQKTFVRLAATKWMHGIPSYGRLPSNRKTKKKQDPKFRIEIIDAVNGTKTSGKASDESKAKFKKWLKLRNARAEFTDVILRKTSPWFKLEDTDFIDYPIIIKVGAYKAPYLIKRVQDRKTFKGITTIKIQLETTDNVDYLSILSKKKELLAAKKKK